MNYEDVFTDWDKIRLQASRKGFLYKDFSGVYEYFVKKGGVQFADNWSETLSKGEKREFCAKMVVLYDDDLKIKFKALKYLKGRGIIWNEQERKFK